MCRNQSSRSDWKYSFSTHKSPLILFSFSIPQRHYQPPSMLPRNWTARTAGSCSLLNGLTWYCISLGQAVFESRDFKFVFTMRYTQQQRLDKSQTPIPGGQFFWEKLLISKVPCYTCTHLNNSRACEFQREKRVCLSRWHCSITQTPSE